MFESKKQAVTVIAEGIRVTGSMSTEGVLEVHGNIDGEVRCASVIVSRQAHIAGVMIADHIVVDGRVDGPIECGEIVLKANAHVTGDIACDTVIIEKGAFVEGRLVRSRAGSAMRPTTLVAQPNAAETATRKLALAEEARYLSGDPDLHIDEALAFLARRGNAQARALLGDGFTSIGPNATHKRSAG